MENLVANVLDTVIGDYLVLDRKQLKLSVLQVRTGAFIQPVCDLEWSSSIGNPTCRAECPG
eukprot:9080253-Pyramimonas_sp.AAC.2